MMPIRIVITSCAELGYAVEDGEATACRAELEKRARQARKNMEKPTGQDDMIADASLGNGLEHYIDKRGTRVYSPREIREIRNRNMQRMNTHRRNVNHTNRR